MAKLSLTMKRSVLQYRHNGLSSAQIAHRLQNEMGIKISRQVIRLLLLCYKQTSRLIKKPGSGRPTKTTQPILQAIEAKMQADDETTATQLQHVLEQSGYKFSVSRQSEELGIHLVGHSMEHATVS